MSNILKEDKLIVVFVYLKKYKIDYSTCFGRTFQDLLRKIAV